MPPPQVDTKEKRAIIEFEKPEPLKGRSIKLFQQSTIFGREKGDIIIQEEGVSSTHCQIQIIDLEYVLFDMNSSNGTFVNDQKIAKHKLEHEDIVRLGGATFTFKFISIKESSSVPTPNQFSLNEDQALENRSRIVDTFLNQSSSDKKWNIALTISYSGKDEKEEKVEINSSEILVGRGSSFGDFDKDPGISRAHLMIKVNHAGEVFIEDQGSTNGTYLKGEKITGLNKVHKHDTIEIGSTKIYVASIKMKT